ncbi:MAG: endonuclease/exonuclease/phosphatase family protein [Bacteroidales bacterium]|jgi:endonuclease/exonuclease/phosphatase family metal-dependent hydrolase|nr:endonuclease/exonuclease/phosphatase family protein [Bacteroidales bacterium]
MGKKAVSYLLNRTGIVLTIALAVTTVISDGKSVTLPPSESMFFQYSGLFFPLIILLNAIILLYWAVRRKWVFIIPLLAIPLCSNFINSTFQFGDKAAVNGNMSGKDPEELTICTYNVGRFGGNDSKYNIKDIGRYLKEQGIDIVCFQEYTEPYGFGRDSIIKYMPSFGYHCISELQDGRDGLAIFSRYPIRYYKYEQYHDSDYGFMYADIDTGYEIVRIFNNHFQTTGLSKAERKDSYYSAADYMSYNFRMREDQADTLDKKASGSPYPLIICGDFNSTPLSYACGKFSGKYTDAFRECGRGFAYTYRYYHKLLRIDYIFYNKDMTGIRYYSEERPWSDHNPVICRMEPLR